MGGILLFDDFPFLPTSIAELALWLDASDTSAANIVQTANAVSQWNDKSGSGNNATQGTGSQQPTTNVATQNGKNTLSFDGGDEFDWAAGFVNSYDGNTTTFVVSKRTVDTGTQVILSNTSNKTITFYGNAGQVLFRSNNSGNNSVANIGNTTTNFNVITAKRDGVEQSISVNSGVASTNSSGSDLTGVSSGRFGSTGGANYLTGSIAEILVYNRALSATEIAQVESYLTNKWLGFQIPTDIGNCQLWLDANDYSTITESSNKVSQWDDKSGQGNNVTQGTGSAQPTTNTTTQNGKNTLSFDGGDEFDWNASFVNAFDGDSTLFIVSKRTTDAVSQTLMSSTSNKMISFYGNAGQVLFRSNNSANDSVANTGNTTTSFSVIMNKRSGTTQAVAVNSAAETTNTGGSDLTGITGGRIGSTGGASYLTGEIAEIIQYNRALSATEITQVESYLTNKWGI